MEEDKKSTAVQPEEPPKPKPRRRKAASPQSAADTPPAPTDSAEPPAADGQTTKKPAASPKKPRAKKNTKTTKTAKSKTPKAAKTVKKAPADETPERKAPAQESPVPAAPELAEPKSESKPEPPETPAREDAAAPTVPDVPSTPELPEPAERAEPAGTEPEPTADAPAADDTPAAAPPEAAAADTAVTDTPEQTGDVPAEDAAEPSGLVFSDDLANDKALAAEAARMANISRTAQLSIAQIMAGLEEDPAPSAGPAPVPEAPQHDSAADDEDDEPQDTIPQALGRGVFGMFKWLLLVVLFVLIIAGGGVAWLYRSATPDMLPEVKVTFDGQELAPTAYKWHVPVVGSFFRRTYAETLNSSPVVLEDAISDASPDIIVTPSDYSTQLTITDADRGTVYEGSVTGFRSYLFAENGTFDAKLVVTASDSAAEDRSSVTGTETWQFRFTVSIKPSITLCTPTVQQGSVAAVRVGSTMSRTEPTLTGPLESTGFVRAANGWICYLPIPWNAETGNTELTVTADGYTETLTLSVRAASYSYKDYSAKSQLTSPYIGADDAPDAVRRLLTTDGGEIQWATGGFVQPFLDSFDTPLLYGMTEYVGRSYSAARTTATAGAPRQMSSSSRKSRRIL